VSTLAVLFGCFPLDGLLRARGETRAILLSYLVKALVTVPLVLLLVEMFGLIGGVLSWLLAEAVGKVLLVARLPRALQLASPRQLLGLVPFRDGLQATLAAGGAVAAMLVWHRVIAGHFDWLPHTFFWRLVPLASDALVFTVTYVAVPPRPGDPGAPGAVDAPALASRGGSGAAGPARPRGAAEAPVL
jgi:hypothetical protein